MPPLTGHSTQPLQKETMKRRSLGQRLQQGAPADFPGVVLPNPDNIHPQKDTDSAPAPRMSYGARFSIKNYTGGREGNMKNGTQLWPDVYEREQ